MQKPTLRRATRTGLVLFLAGLCAGRAAAQTPSPAGDATLILNRNTYFRVYTEFGLMRLSGAALRQEGLTLFNAPGLARIEQRSKALLAGRNYDWTKTDWRDEACFYMFTGQAGDDSGAMSMIQTVPPPADWAKPEFDDNAFDRVRPGTPGQVLGGDDFRETSSLLYRGRYLRTYFEIPDPAAAGDLTVKAIYRGGARVFVNGTEVARGNLAPGPVTSETFGSDYPAEAYVAGKDELPERPGLGDWVGDIRCDFDDAQRPEGARSGQDFRLTYGNASINRAGWERVRKLRDRELGPVRIPAALLRKGRNVLAIEIRTSKYHPILIPGARCIGTETDANRRGWGGGMGRSVRWNHAALVNVELRSARPLPSCLRRPGGMQAWVDDVHDWLLDRNFNPVGFPAGTVRFVGGQNGSYSAQIGVGTDRALAGLKAVCSDLAGANGARIPAAAIQVSYPVGHGLLEMAQLGASRCAPGELGGVCPVAEQLLWRYSDGRNPYGPLPKDGEAATKARAQYLQNFKFFDHIGPKPPATVPANSCQPVWLALKVPEAAAPGLYKGTVTVAAEGQPGVVLPVEAEVIGWRMPSPTEFQTFVQSEQTPYGILKAYKVEPWSERHWQLIESSFRQLARLGNDWVYVPVLMNSEIGNREDTMVRWIRKRDGSLAFDFSLMDKYVGLASRIQGRPKAVCFLVQQAAASTSNGVKVFDETTGKTEVVELGPAQDATRKPYWRAFGAAAHAHMKSLGLLEAMYFGQVFDDIPDKGIIGILAEVAPDIGWTCAGHERPPDATFRLAARAYGVDVSARSAMGWKNPYVHLLMARTGGSVICVEGISTPFSWRVMGDRAIYTGFNGIGRAGADYFDRTWFDGFVGGYWCMVGRGSVMTLWPGAEGVDSSLRNEAMLEGIQEADIRIFLEQALDRKVLPDDLAKETQTVLDDHFRATLHIPTGVRDNQTMDIAQNWQNRSRRLLATAAKVGARIGIDVDKTEFGGAAVTLIREGQKQSFVGSKVSVAALGETRLTLKLRNWSDKPRAWKATATEPWIVPEKPAGTVLGQQELGIVLSGASLKPGTDVSGTLHVTDVATGTEYPVRITATVVKAIEYQTRQDVKFITGGGAGAEGPKLIHVVKEPVLNVPVGGSDAREYYLVSRAKDKQTWSLAANGDWLTAEPPSGEIAPGASVLVRIVARPKDTAGAVRDAVLTLTAAGGAVKEDYRVRTYVIPPYRTPAVPPGQPVYLNDLDQKRFLKDHVDAGFSKNTRDPRPWIFADVPTPYYNRFNRAEGAPEGMKREDYATAPYVLGGKTYTHGLWVSPTHETLYNIEGAGFSAFAADVGFYDKLAKNSYANLGSVVSFEIYVDGALRAQSGLMKFGDATRLLVVGNLKDAKEVKLVTRRDDLVNDWYTLGTWADPRFIK